MPGAKLVKAYSSFQPSALRRLADHPLEQRLAVVAGNDVEAKAIVTFLRKIAVVVFDLGSLYKGRLMEIPGPFAQ